MKSPLLFRRPNMVFMAIRLLGIFLGLCLSVHAVAAPTNNPAIMIVGDSISQGQEGDFTWRYRLWEWFQNNGVQVRFVGPYSGTVQQKSPEPPTPPPAYGSESTPGGPPAVRQRGGYNRNIPTGSSFLVDGKNHFAAWGRQVAQDKDLIRDMVAQYKPDYLLVELGFNDVGWFVSDALGTLQSMATFIKNAREAKPDIAFAIANIPHRSFIGGRDDLITKTEEYNAAFPGLIASLSTDKSPIRLVRFRESYDCNPDKCPAGYDGLHPNARGEFQIAKAFADTLSKGYRWPGSPFSLPSNIPARSCNTPTNVVARLTTCGVTVSWTPVEGAHEYIFSYAFNDGPMTSVTVNSASYTTTWTAPNIKWTFEVQAVCSDAVSGKSRQVSAVANPAGAPGPSNVRVKSTPDGVDLTWDAVKGYNVQKYGAIYWNRKRDAFVQNYGWTGTSASYHGMKPGDRVETAVETWANVNGDTCAALPAPGQGVVVGGIMPSAPKGLKVFTINEGATVQLNFEPDPNAYAYGFYTRSLMKSGEPHVLGGYTAQEPCIEVTFLMPGAWNYEFCVVALNGNYSSPMSGCVKGPKEITKVGSCASANLPPNGPSQNPTATWSMPDEPTKTPGDGGDGGSVVYIDPDIWNSADPTAACQAPCTLVLPPWRLSTMTTIGFPIVTETLKETWPKTVDGVITYITTTITVLITIPPITTSIIDVSNIILRSQTSDLVRITSSIIPPPVVLTEHSHGITYTYKAGPFPTGTVIGPPPIGKPGSIHITIGPPRPTCLGIGCGHICIFNCGPKKIGGGGGGGSGIGCIGPGCPPGAGGCVGEGCEDPKESTETCATETNTECHQVCTTRPCKTECNTYVGCDCITSTSTYYWVSCSANSCKTTSSDAITGCFLTATTSTTQGSCPTLTLDPLNDDQGDDSRRSVKPGRLVTVTYPQSVVVEMTPYPVSSGYVNVDKTAYAIPDVKSPSKTMLGGKEASIYPTHIGQSFSITLPNVSRSTRIQPPATTTVGLPSTTKTSPLAYPTNVKESKGTALCFDKYPGYERFTKDNAKFIIEDFCQSKYVLDAGNAFGHANVLESGPIRVVASIKWAVDQSSCGPKRSLPLYIKGNIDACIQPWDINYSCRTKDDTDSNIIYGGAYIFNTEGGGCVLVSLYAYDARNQFFRGSGANPLEPPAYNLTLPGPIPKWEFNGTGNGMFSVIEK